MTKLLTSIKSAGAFWHWLGAPKGASQAKTPHLETEAETTILTALLMRVEQCWHQLGETEPHWSVITDAKFKTDRIAETHEDFYNSGLGDVSLFRIAADRCGVALPLQGTCFELGCGVGRSTIWLAKSFRRVIGADISSAHLALAEQVVRRSGYHNVELRLVNRLDAFDQLPSFDSFFSVIVLQHNPPPVIRWLLQKILSRLKLGGIAFFQLLTGFPNYSFSAEAYLARSPLGSEMGMHILPYETVLDILGQTGCELLEARALDCVGEPNSISKAFLVRKIAPPYCGE